MSVGEMTTDKGGNGTSEDRACDRSWINLDSGFPCFCGLPFGHGEPCRCGECGAAADVSNLYSDTQGRE